MQAEKLRSTIQPETIQRLGKYTTIRFGMRADDLINEAISNLEKQLTELQKQTSAPQIKSKESRRK